MSTSDNEITYVVHVVKAALEPFDDFDTQQHIFDVAKAQMTNTDFKKWPESGPQQLAVTVIRALLSGCWTLIEKKGPDEILRLVRLRQRGSHL